jgi:hypothetical protein
LRIGDTSEGMSYLDDAARRFCDRFMSRFAIFIVELPLSVSMDGVVTTFKPNGETLYNNIRNITRSGSTARRSTTSGKLLFETDYPLEASDHDCTSAGCAQPSSPSLAQRAGSLTRSLGLRIRGAQIVGLLIFPCLSGASRAFCSIPDSRTHGLRTLGDTTITKLGLSFSPIRPYLMTVLQRVLADGIFQKHSLRARGNAP